jgi:hypothetical protein
MDAFPQTEPVDERNGRLRSLEVTGVGNMTILGLGAGFAITSSPHAFNIPQRIINPRVTFNYDEIISREFPPVPMSGNVPHASLATHSSHASKFRERELEWRRTHVETLNSLANKWVVLEGDQVVAHGDDPLEVVKEARSKGVQTPYIFFVDQKSENVVQMGL